MSVYYSELRKYLAKAEYIHQNEIAIRIKEKLDTVFKDNNAPETVTNDSETKIDESTKVQTETPRYAPNVDRFKDVPANVVGSYNDNK